MKMGEISIRTYQSQEEAQVISLWEECGLVVPQNNPQHDIQSKLAVDPDLFLVALQEDILIGTVMAGYEGHRGWINYLGVLPSYQGQGVARRLMEEAELRLKERGCPKINLQVRTSNQEVIQFYQHIGFSIDDVVSMGKRLEE